MARGLSDDFKQEFKTGGKYNCVIEEVKKDHTLHFQIRDDYINIYYRGCSILKLEANGKIVKIAQKYYKNTIADINDWIKNIAYLKQGVDYYNPPAEREYQQVVARDNSFSNISNSTDYFIVDTEIVDSGTKSRPDMFAIKWLSTGSNRKKDECCKLAIIEMKYGKDALGNLVKHIDDVLECVKNNKINALRKDIVEQFKQLRELGLIQFSSSGNTNEVSCLDGEVELIILFANYDTESKEIDKHLPDIKKRIPQLKENNINLKFATSSFMGYGLYEKFMLSLDEFESLLIKRRI